MTGLRIGSLCSGYGGLDMAVLAVLGGHAAWHCQWDPEDRHQYAARILAQRWPTVPNLGDLTAVDWHQVPPVDILTGGYPCQPFSIAGRRKGTNDARHLWPHIARALGVLRPRLVFLENVAGHLSLGFADVLADLAALGFDAEWVCVRASDTGAPHHRERLFVLARHPDRMARPTPGARRRRPGPLDGSGAVQRTVRPGRVPVPDPGRHARAQDHADNASPARGGGTADGTDWREYAPAVSRWEHATGRAAPHPTEHAPDGRQCLSPRFVEWLMGLPDGHVTAVPGIPRTAQLKALGNGVVPQQAAYALRLLLDQVAADLEQAA